MWKKAEIFLKLSLQSLFKNAKKDKILYYVNLDYILTFISLLNDSITATRGRGNWRGSLTVIFCFSFLKSLSGNQTFSLEKSLKHAQGYKTFMIIIDLMFQPNRSHKRPAGIVFFKTQQTRLS